MPPGFYNPYDQQVYDAGFKYIPQSRYLLNPFQIPTDDSTTTPPNTGGITTLPTGGGGGGSTYTGTIGGLTSDFFNTISDRQNRLTELNRPLAEAQFPSFPGARMVEGTYDQPMYNFNNAARQYNKAKAAQDAGEYFQGFTGLRDPQEVMDYADDKIQDYRMQYATGQLGPSYIPAEKPTFNRRISDFFYDKLGFTKPQSADQILEEGYNKPYGSMGPGILGAILGKMDNYSNLPVADQAFIAKNMGYTGPTVFGANDSGLSKDPFGLNTRSGFGNYAERVGVESEKLGDALSATGAIGGKSAYQGATFNPATGMFEADDDDETSIAAAMKANQMTKMVRAKYNFYTKQNQDYADTVQKAAEIQAAKDKDIVDKIGVTADDVASTTTQGGGGGIASSAYGQGGGKDAASMGGGSQQAKSSGGAKTDRTDGGWGWADGGRVYYMDGGLADMLEIYD